MHGTDLALVVGVPQVGDRAVRRLELLDHRAVAALADQVRRDEAGRPMDLPRDHGIKKSNHNQSVKQGTDAKAWIRYGCMLIGRCDAPAPPRR